MKEVKNLNRWKYYNLDRVEEILENNPKAVILLCGASSSGKSFAAEELKNVFKENNLNSVIISTDSYNKGISGIICDKVNIKYFKNSLKNIEKIKEIVKKCIINTNFNDKFNKNDLINIKNGIKNLIDKKDINNFLCLLKKEFDIINFDEPQVYDLIKVARDVNRLLDNQVIKEKKYSKIISEQLPRDTLIDGKAIDVIIVEGIYSLEKAVVNNINKDLVVSSFIEGNAKSLFLRRVIRDAKSTSADNCFTISSYFKYIVPSYINTILPNKFNSDFVLKNDISFSELRSGNLYTTKEKVLVNNPNLIKELLNMGKVILKEKHCDIYFYSEGENISEQNLLRLRTIYDEKTKTYVPTSLIHKGAIKNRKDNKIVRPINLLIKEGDFFKIFKSKQDFLNNMELAQFKIDRQTIKTRTKISINNQELTIDDIKNEGVFVEFSNYKDPKLIEYIKQNATIKNKQISNKRSLQKEKSHTL